MRRSDRPIRIASRRSRLARRQAEMIGQVLARLHPDVAVQYRWIESEGDRTVDRELAAEGGKGLFTSAVEQVLLKNEADLAVHSMKDMPALASDASLAVVATPMREDVRDCLITHHSIQTIDELPQGATIGTASPRRRSQLLRRRPDLRIELLRGNVETRLRKVLDEKQFDATLLARAGLNRLGMQEHATRPVEVDVLLPAACQGALAIQCRRDDYVTVHRCLTLNEPVTAAAVNAERGIVAGLGGDCHSAIAVLAEPQGPHGSDGYRVRVRVLSLDGRQCLEDEGHAPVHRLGKLVKRMVRSLKERGSDQLLGR